MRRIPLLALLLFCTAAVSAQSLSDLKRLAGKARDVVNSRRQPAGTSSPAAASQSQQASSGIAEGELMLAVTRNFTTTDSTLHSELSINGQLVNIFTADVTEAVGRYFREGWNDIRLVTTPQEPATDQNDLIFRIGPARRDPRAGAVGMAPVLWQFRNGTDWKLGQDGRWRHALGPKVKQVQVDLRVYWAGMKEEARELEEGDLVLIVKPNFETSWNSSVSGTVFVNGTPLTTFMQPERQVVITPYLKKGKNEIRLVSTRVTNGNVADNDLHFTIAGPARWSASEGKYVVKPLLQFKGLQGWVRDSMSGQLVNRADPGSASIERVIPLLLKDSDHAAGE